jgi:hypothetical protein
MAERGCHQSAAKRTLKTIIVASSSPGLACSVVYWVAKRQRNVGKT